MMPFFGKFFQSFNIIFANEDIDLLEKCLLLSRCIKLLLKFLDCFWVVG